MSLSVMVEVVPVYRVRDRRPWAGPQFPPTLTAVSPPAGLTSGGTAITLTGSNFSEGSTVTFGGNPATSVVVVSDTSVTCNTPAGTAGAQDVVVTDAAGRASTLTGGFYYVSAGGGGGGSIFTSSIISGGAIL